MQWLYEEFMAWLVDIIAGVLAAFTQSFLGFFSMNFYGFYQIFVPLNSLYGVFVSVGIGLVIVLASMRLLANMPAVFTDNYEDPKKMVGRIILAIFLVGNAKLIVKEEFKLAIIPYNMVKELFNSDTFKDSVSVADTSGKWSIFASSSDCWDGMTFTGGEVVADVVAIIVLIAVGFNFFKLLLEAAERYVVMNLAFLFSPLVFSTVTTKETSRVFPTFIRVVFNQMLLMSFNMVFIQGVMYALNHAADFVHGVTLSTGNVVGNFFTFTVLILAFEIAGQKMDEYMRAIGLDVVQTGSILDELRGAFHGIRDIASAAQMGYRSAGSIKNAVKAGVGQIGAAFGSERMQDFAKTSMRGKAMDGAKGAFSSILPGIANQASTNQAINSFKHGEFTGKHISDDVAKKAIGPMAFQSLNADKQSMFGAQVGHDNNGNIAHGIKMKKDGKDLQFTKANMDGQFGWKKAPDLGGYVKGAGAGALKASAGSVGSIVGSAIGASAEGSQAKAILGSTGAKTMANAVSNAAVTGNKNAMVLNNSIRSALKTSGINEVANLTGASKEQMQKFNEALGKDVNIVGNSDGSWSFTDKNNQHLMTMGDGDTMSKLQGTKIDDGAGGDLTMVFANDQSNMSKFTDDVQKGFVDFEDGKTIPAKTVVDALTGSDGFKDMNLDADYGNITGIQRNVDEQGNSSYAVSMSDGNKGTKTVDVGSDVVSDFMDVYKIKPGDNSANYMGVNSLIDTDEFNRATKDDALGWKLNEATGNLEIQTAGSMKGYQLTDAIDGDTNKVIHGASFDSDTGIGQNFNVERIGKSVSMPSEADTTEQILAPVNESMGEEVANYVTEAANEATDITPLVGTNVISDAETITDISDVVDVSVDEIETNIEELPKEFKTKDEIDQEELKRYSEDYKSSSFNPKDFSKE